MKVYITKQIGFENTLPIPKDGQNVYIKFVKLSLQSPIGLFHTDDKSLQEAIECSSLYKSGEITLEGGIDDKVLREAEELEAQKQKEAELEAKKQKEADELEAQKQKEADELEAHKQKEAELEAKKQKEADELEAQKQKEADELEAQKQKEADELEAQKQKEAEELEVKKVDNEDTKDSETEESKKVETTEAAPEVTDTTEGKQRVFELVKTLQDAKAILVNEFGVKVNALAKEANIRNKAKELGVIFPNLPEPTE